MSTYRLNMWQILQIECWRHHVVIVILKYPILLRSTVKHVFTHRYRLIAPNGENKALPQGKMHVNNNNTDIRIGVSASWIWYVVSWVKTNYMHTNNSSSHYKLLVLRLEIETACVYSSNKDGKYAENSFSACAGYEWMTEAYGNWWNIKQQRVPNTHRMLAKTRCLYTSSVEVLINLRHYWPEWHKMMSKTK